MFGIMGTLIVFPLDAIKALQVATVLTKSYISTGDLMNGMPLCKSCSEPLQKQLPSAREEENSKMESLYERTWYNLCSLDDDK